MNVLGIDYGRRKVGLAISLSSLSEPYKVIRYKHTNQLFRQIRAVIQELGIEKIIIGVSEGAMEIEIKNFGEVLQKEIEIPVEYFDETLTSLDARNLSQESGIKRKKRKNMEDAYAASLMLQGYLDK